MAATPATPTHDDSCLLELLELVGSSRYQDEGA
jgi:hypothetical protein